MGAQSSGIERYDEIQTKIIKKFKKHVTNYLSFQSVKSYTFFARRLNKKKKAQVDVKGDGSFEYKFRIRNVDLNTGEATNFFEGQYTVNIFKVIPNSDEII